jgi:hypothetical protein
MSAYYSVMQVALLFHRILLMNIYETFLFSGHTYNMSKSKAKSCHKDHRRGGRSAGNDRAKQRDNKFDEERFVLEMQAAIDGESVFDENVAVVDGFM